MSGEPPSILVIMGSTRAGRRCPVIARWVIDIARGAGDRALELIDLRDWPLPADDEPAIPATGRYEHEHSRAWSAKIASAAGVAIVSPQYNWGYPAPLKNALDHLYKEWNGKPLAIITYGAHGGDKCAAQLAQVCEGLRMRPVPTRPAIILSRAMIEGQAEMAPERDFADSVPAIRQCFTELVAAIAGG